jgi:hypothetical protein
MFLHPKGFINTEGETEYRMEQAGSLEAGEFIDMVIEQGDKGDTLAKQFGPKENLNSYAHFSGMEILFGCTIGTSCQGKGVPSF